MSPTIALALPHAYWIPERLTAMEGLRPQLVGADKYLELTDKEPWPSWAMKAWTWAVGTGCDYFLSLNDDVELAPHFWPSLRAMLQAWPGDVLTLAAAHPLGPEVARQGRRSYLSPVLAGWGWAMPRALLADLVNWCEAGALQRWIDRGTSDGEDSLALSFLTERGIVPRCPVPTIVDHRHLPSAYGNDDHTMRRSTVTWRGYAAEDMAETSWWQSTASMLPPPQWRRCWWCGDRSPIATSKKTGAQLCGVCITGLVGERCGLTIAAR